MSIGILKQKGGPVFWSPQIWAEVELTYDDDLWLPVNPFYKNISKDSLSEEELV